MHGHPLRLLLVVHHLSPDGGAEIQLAYLARGLAEAGHDVTLCCIANSGVPARVLENAGVTVVELRARSRIGRIAAIRRLARLARAANVVHCTMWDASLWGRIAAMLARRPVVVADHATDRSVQIAASGAPRGSWIARHNRALDRFTYATVICATSQRPVLTGEGVDPDKIVHIPNGVPVDELARAAEQGPSRNELGLPEGVPLAIQVGVFRAEKNQRGALDAFREVRGQVADARLAFVGDGKKLEEVERRVEEIGAGDWAHFLGRRSDVPALLVLADLMLLPSISDAMPMTILEAMAVGVPVVATDVGDVRRTLGDAGVCVPAGDETAFAEQCIRLFSNPELRARMGEAGRARVRSFDLSAMVRGYEALFEAATAGSPPIPAVEADG